MPVTAPFLLNFSIFLCVAGVVGFGVYPKPLVMAALRAKPVLGRDTAPPSLTV